MFNLDEKEIIWMAGLFEGEGWIYVGRRAGRKPSPNLGIKMTDEDVIAAFANKINSKYFKVWKEEPVDRKQCYQIKVQGPKALKVALMLYPYLYSRRQGQIDAVLGDLGGE